MALFRIHVAIDNPSNKIKHEKISYPLYFCMFTLPIYWFERTVKEIYSEIESCLALWVLWWWLLSSFWCYGFGCKLWHHCFAYQMNMMTAQSQLCFDNLSVDNAGVYVRSKLW